MKIACGTTLSHVRLHSRIYVLTHIKEVCSSALPVVKDCRKMCVGDVLLFAELPKSSHTPLNKIRCNASSIIPDCWRNFWVVTMIHSRK